MSQATFTIIYWLRYLFTDTDPPLSHKRQLCGGSQLAIEKMLQFGRELQAMSTQLRKEHGKDEANKKALQVGSLVGHLARRPDYVGIVAYAGQELI